MVMDFNDTKRLILIQIKAIKNSSEFNLIQFEMNQIRNILRNYGELELINSFNEINRSKLSLNTKEKLLKQLYKLIEIMERDFKN